MTLGLKFLLCQIRKFFNFKKILSGIMEFQLQKIYSTETVGKAFALQGWVQAEITVHRL